ncbi:hypothetical protein C2G38_2200644 [Gigaspora rosea]|uniref:Uncharacterized protein n=1 Tax=Gigaspora rosea TaxID=44941 RepID=A0A397USY9_9GLOM|nr:hypothetical protein C2G38_2200644 [Gigaspora rosea]
MGTKNLMYPTDLWFAEVLKLDAKNVDKKSVATIVGVYLCVLNEHITEHSAIVRTTE